MENPSPRAHYMLFFRNTGPENYQHLSPEQRQEVVTRWNDWFEGLLAQGKALEGQPLVMEARLVSGPGGSRVTDGPFIEGKEAIAGYVTLLVSDIDEAVAIAQRHPGLAYGMKIEVRQMTPDCHLGVNTKARGRSTQEVAAR
ncbi:MAG TPA: YciI family protein [Lacunisphaera sp.]|nr:YciI family protein [Lacunisphaera sp.]